MLLFFDCKDTTIFLYSEKYYWITLDQPPVTDSLLKTVFPRSADFSKWLLARFWPLQLQ